MPSAGALSYLTVRPPEALSYGAPAMDFGWLSQLPQQYQQGFQNARERRLATMFEPGTPGAEALARGDYGGIFRQIAQAGGAPAVSQLLPQMMGLGVAQQLLGSEGQGGPATGAPAPVQQPRGTRGQPPFAPGPAASTNGVGPANLGTDNFGKDSLASLTSETLGGDIDNSPAMNAVARKLGIHPADELTPAQVNQAKYLLGVEAAKTRLASTGDVSGLGGPTRPPASTSAAGPAVMAQAAPTPAAPPAASGLLPGDSMDALANMRAAQQTQEQKAKAASVFNKELSTRFENSANAIKARADAMEGRLAKQQETQYGVTVEGQKKVQAGDIDRGLKAYSGINAQSQQYERDLKPLLDLSRSILNDPEMYTGFGAQRRLDFDRVATNYGYAKAAMLKEGLQKITASSVLAQINTQRDQLQEAGSNSGRIFASQVDQVTKAAPHLETSLGGNRFLVEVATRTGNLTSKVAEMARDYLQTRPYLDKNFDQQLSDYMKKNPIFSKQELSHPELLGAPSLPPDLVGRPAIMRWGQAHGLKSGDAIRTPDGRILAMP